jgi:uridine kinase
MDDVEEAVALILATREAVPPRRAALIGISGIDGSGKGYLTGKIAARLEERGVRVAVINVDGWLNLPHRRFNPANPAEHFYAHSIRFEEMFAQLILPLREHRSHRVTAEFAEETATEYCPHSYVFEDVEVILLEGIFLFKPAYRGHFDRTLWVDCTFETALERALQRGQEELPPEATVRAYETIYFPAQRIHFTRDNPRAAASVILPNDPRLIGPSPDHSPTIS